jgi:hypothetical protein
MTTAATYRNDYNGAGSTGPFTYSFPIVLAADLLVVKRTAAGVDSVLALTTDYTIAGVGAAAGGSITLVTALASGEKLSLVQQPAITNDTNVDDYNPYLGSVITARFDRLTRQLQWLYDNASRSLKLSTPFGPGPISTTASDPVALEFLRINAAGTGIEFADPGSVALAVPADGSVTWAKVDPTLGIFNLATWQGLGAGATLTASAFGRVQFLFGTASDYTVNLPSCNGYIGYSIMIHVGAYSIANKQYAIVPAGGQTIDGLAGLKLTHGNTIVLQVYDNTTWHIMHADWNSPWVNGGAITITGTTSNPVKGTTNTDQYFWRRVGRQNIEVRFEYYQTNAGTDGVGTYLFNVPFTADNTIMSAGTGATGYASIGSCSWAATLGTSKFGVGGVYLWDTGKVALGDLITTATPTIASGPLAAGSTPFAGVPLKITATMSYPVNGW